GRFELNRPEQHQEVGRIIGAPADADELILTRRLTCAGRSYGYANEQPVSLATLRQLGNLLVDVHGQRESLSLLQPAYQLQLLDAFGNLNAERQAFVDLAERMRDLI